VDIDAAAGFFGAELLSVGVAAASVGVDGVSATAAGPTAVAPPMPLTAGAVLGRGKRRRFAAPQERTQRIPRPASGSVELASLPILDG